ncbi:MAG: tRNA (adenosine(37)-N6)-threonylcarbamoyltransferase complex transferase subunit TsaD [Verrucomicrobiales bacterium]|nr:tRNA (adenosine(37)-N6)-threonylcarbamoyltransferase complex transferase subunit TsaD [Verrucomicrobiales bacterium]
MLLAFETSCDETAVAICTRDGGILASEVSSQIEAHRPFGGVVPELASRSHIQRIRPLVEQVLRQSGVTLREIGAFAATVGPGLASSLLIGSTVAKSLALACGRPFLAVNHLEGHLLSPFIGSPEIRPHVALIVSGGHTSLVQVKGAGNYCVLGKTRDDAAGEAFDKAAKMLGLPYPGGPQIDRLAAVGDRAAFEFPRSMLDSGGFAFSFSGLKTSLLYLLPRLSGAVAERLPDLCASFQEAIVDVLTAKTLRAAKKCSAALVAVSGGVSCNRRLREVFRQRCQAAGLELLLAEPVHTTDNAAMIAYAAVQRWLKGECSPLEADVDPNLPLQSLSG